VIAFLVGCTSTRRLDSTKFDVIPVPQGLQDPRRFEDVQQRLSKGGTVIFKAAKRERMPVKMALDLPVGTLEPSAQTFVFKHETYFLLSRKGLELSPDGQRWTSIKNPKQIVKLFAPETKHVSVGLGFNSATNESPFMSLEVRTK
jgi:hypothetical protein